MEAKECRKLYSEELHNLHSTKSWLINVAEHVGRMCK